MILLNKKDDEKGGGSVWQKELARCLAIFQEAL